MPKAILTTFMGGEISGKLAGSTGIAKYYQSCSVLENYLLMVPSGAERRPGSYYTATSKTASKKIRLIPFEYSTSINYILEFGDQYIRVYKDHAQVENGGSPYEVSGSPPYLEAELFEINYRMIESEMYLFHPSHAPRKLTRTTDTSWALSTPTFTGWDPDTEKDITAMTAANPVVVTAAGHGYSNGDTIRIVGIKGMPEANCKIYKVAGAATDTFQLTGVNGTDFTPYVSGGKVIKKDQIFDSANNYPSCVAFYGNRMIVGATNNQPADYWGSKVWYCTDFVIDTDDDSAFHYSIGAKKGSRIMWIVGHDGLVIGSNIEEYVVPGEGGYLTPYNAMPYPRSAYGSKNIQAELVGDSVLFFQRAGKRLREYIYSNETAGYVATDLTAAADHITGSGIVEMALQTEPQTILWCVTSAGGLIGSTYERQYNFAGWHRHPTNGTVESVAVKPTANEDEIWISVLRSDPDSKRYIEYFKPRNYGTDQADCFFVDSGITFDGGSAKNITGATQAKPVVITSAAHGFENDQIVKIRKVGGMIELNTTNDGYYMVKNKATDTLELYHTDGTTQIDGTGFTAFDSGITGDTTRLSDQVTEVSAADIATLIVGMSISGSGIPSGTTITEIDTASFTISNEATATAADVSLTVTGAAQRVIKTMTGLDHHDDETVAVLTDGAAHPDRTVSSGSISLDRYANVVHAGLEFDSKLHPMELETRGRKVRIANLLIRFYKSLGCKAGPDEDHLETIIFRKGSDPMDSPPPLFTGEKETPGWKGGYEEEGNVFITQDQPLPSVILALIAEMQEYG